ncbi:MAG TPA: methyl-accepting chemotaxis protein [Candidatus Binatia bacterium]|nr:methyl-accepting chemotaxis protein [Candidatus Binatia bacterium]
MVARTKPQAASPAVRIATATRSGSAEPGRAGAVRLAVLSLAVAALVGGAAWLAIRSLVERDALEHLDAVRQAATRSLAESLAEIRRSTQSLADDPRVSRALRELRDAGDRPAEKTKGGGDSANASAARVAADLNGWLQPLAHRNGWDSVLLVDTPGAQILYSSTKLTDGVTSLRGAGMRESELAKIARGTNDGPASDGARLSDVERSPAFGDRAMLFSAAPVFDGATRVGTVVAAVSADRIDGALVAGTDSDRWQRLGLGGRGDVFAVGPDGKLRSTPRSYLIDPQAFWQQANPDDPDASAEASPIALAPARSAGVEQAVASGEGRARFDGASGPVLGSYGGTRVGDRPWTIAVERPEGEVMAPLRGLVPAFALVAALAAALGWLVGGRLWQQFGRTLHRLTEGAQRALRGDRSARLDASQGGAMGDLAVVLNRLLDERQLLLEKADEENQRVTTDASSLIDVVREVAEGNLAQRAAVAEGPLGGVSQALNEMLDTVGTLVSTLKQTTGRVGASADQIRTSAEQASRGAATQARECGTTTASLEELRATAERIDEQCTTALEIARRNEQATRQGQTAIGDVIAGMESLSRETRSATVKIKRLGERSMQISAIIGAISKMSAQTDMLALNAAIEASRAGEHGQGFTVVAEEVRKLAERAAASTKEIERLIAGIQADVNEAVSGMERQGERLEVQAAAASEAQHALERVVSATSDVSAAVQSIAQGVEHQTGCAGHLGDAVTRLAEGAQGVQQSTEVARRTTGELIHAFEELDARASRFHS